MHSWELQGKVLQKAWVHWIPHTALFQGRDPSHCPPPRKGSDHTAPLQAADLCRAHSHNAWGWGPRRSLIQRSSCCILCCIHSCSHQSQHQGCCWLWLWILAFSNFPCPFMLFSLITVRSDAGPGYIFLEIQKQSSERNRGTDNPTLTPEKPP